MKQVIISICVIGLLTLCGYFVFSGGSTKLDEAELAKINEFHKATLKAEPAQLEASSDGKGGSCVDLYVDYSDCMTTANSSQYYLGVQPAILACAPNYYSIKGDKISYETSDKDQVYQRLNGITNVDYSDIKAAVDSIVSKNHEAILITDGEYYRKGIGSSLHNPYLADGFKTWLDKGHDIYVYSEPYESNNFTKQRYYMIFTDHRLPNNIQEIFSRNAPKNGDVKMVHIYNGIPTIETSKDNIKFHLEANDEHVESGENYEVYNLDGKWDDMVQGILKAEYDDEGNPITGGDFFMKGLKVNIPSEDAYYPEELEIKCFEVDSISLSNPSKGKLGKELKNIFTIDEDAWKKNKDIIIKMDPNFNEGSLTGTEGNLIRMDICVKKSKDNFSNNKGISDTFKFDSPYGFNTSVYESIRQILNDQYNSPEAKGNSVLYTIYLNTYTI